MRRLLLAALGAAGSLLIELPALAQLSNTTSTFSGQVAATCSILRLPENMSYWYEHTDNTLRLRTNFDVTSNLSSSRLTIDRLTVVEEPPPNGQTIRSDITVFADYGNTVVGLTATKDQASLSKPFPVPVTVVIEGLVDTREWQIVHSMLPPGRYTYRTTITCLQ